MKIFDKEARLYVWKKSWKALNKGVFERGTCRWFPGGKLNITENCIDRHLKKQGDSIALIWEPNEPNGSHVTGKTYTFAELHHEVCRMANVLKKHGVKKGDYVCIYMPMIPQAAFAMLACARIGAVHNVVFAGFSSQSLADRINDCGAKIVITSDIGYRGAKEIHIKQIVDEALKQCPKVKETLVFERLKKGAFERELEKASPVCPPTIVKSEEPLFVLYTSGSTGKPKGLVHGAGGYMVYAGYSFKQVFDYKPKEIFWCTADIGWITGHTYTLYGALLSGVTTLVYEGLPTYPTPSRFWEIIEKYKVNIFYTAPTAIRSLASFGDVYVDKFKLKSLRLIGSVGEPLNVEAYNWYHKHVGKEKCSIVDTWWQTETGGILISPQVDLRQKPGSVGKPLHGIVPVLLDVNGKEIKKADVSGSLCIKAPWPGMAMTILNDHVRFLKTYFGTFKGYYKSGDSAKRDADGYYFVAGRMDDVMNVSGHRLGSAEIENAINFHPDVVESSVISFAHPIKGEGIYAMVILRNERTDRDILQKEIILTVEKVIGPIAKPDKIQIVKDLPKTRSGKIIRRVLRRLVSGDTCESEDLTTLTNPDVIVEIRQGVVR